MAAVPAPAASASDGNLYVSSGITNEVKRYDASTGNFTGTFIAAGSKGLVNPVYLAFGPDGNLYVTSEFSKNIQRYNGTTGNFTDVFVPAGSGGLRDLLGITFGPDGNLYAVNFSSNEVKRYNGNTGVFVDNFVQADNNGGLSNPVTLTFGPDGNLYIGGTHDNVKRYNGSTGAFIDDFIPEGSTGLGTTSALTFGPDGNLYIASFGLPTEIKRFNGTTGAFMDNFVDAEENGGLSLPSALTFGPDSNLYALSGAPTQEVKRYNGTTGAFMDNFIAASNNGGLEGSGGLTFGPGGNLYVTSTGSNEIKRYNGTTGAFIDNFVRAGDAGLRSPADLLFSPDGNLYVNNVGMEEVKRYNGTTGALINNIGGAGNRGDMAVGPDWNLYVTGRFRPTSIFPEIDRYNSTTGAFIDQFASQGRLDLPFALAFGPDGNLYVSSVGSGVIERYNGTTGVFSGNFLNVGNSSGAGLQGATEFTFGPDGNLYAIVADVVSGSPPQITVQEVKRYNGTTGAFMDIFVPKGVGGLSHPFELAFGPDGNLYVIDDTNDVKRYNGTTGAFMDIPVPAASVGPGGASGLAFSTVPTPPETKHMLTVNAVDLAGKPISGIWTTVRQLDGTLLKSGYTPFSFTGNAGTAYKISVANYDGKLFQHWNDDVRISNTRTVAISTSDITITATYDTGDSLRGFTSLTYTGTEEQPDLTVNALAASTGKALHMWTVIDPQSNNDSSTTYRVYAGNYRDLVFDHWDDGNKDRIRTLTINETTTITAYYRTEPQNVKVEFAYKDCGLSAAGCGVGTITCSDGTTEGPGPISLAFGFTVSKSSGNPAMGIWRAAIPGAAGPSGASGSLNALSFDGPAGSFKTEGDIASGAICQGDPLPSPTNNIKVAFSGACGGTEIRFEATNGTKATIQGDVTCTTL